MSTQRPARKIWWGFFDMGAIQIPPNPKYLVITDRDTGQLWWVTFNLTTVPSSDGFGYVAVNSVLPANSYYDGASNGPQTIPPPRPYNNLVIYDAFDEPIIGFFDPSTYVRLIIRSGTLGISIEAVNPQFGTPPLGVPPLNLIQDTKILGFNTQYDTIILSTTSPNWVGWIPTILTQTPNPSPVQTYD